VGLFEKAKMRKGESIREFSRRNIVGVFIL
jgi:hypothetical protein